MERCEHGLDATYCYLCRVDQSAVPQAVWGLEDASVDGWEFRTEPVGEAQAEYLRFLCGEFGYSFEPDLSAGEADILIESFLEEPMTERQANTLETLAQGAGQEAPTELTYAEARKRIRTLVAQRALRFSA